MLQWRDGGNKWKNRGRSKTTSVLEEEDDLVLVNGRWSTRLGCVWLRVQTAWVGANQILPGHPIRLSVWLSSWSEPSFVFGLLSRSECSDPLSCLVV
jgi:hypothetical protein